MRAAPLVLCVLSVLTACTQAQDSRPAKKDPPASRPAATLTSVSVGRTPGKPMQLAKQGEPAERITAREKTKGGFELVVARNVGEDFVQAKADLTREEWASVEELVRKHALATWKPKAREGRVIDWGGALLEVQQGEKPRVVTWTRPLTNSEGADALFKRLGELAKAKIKTPRLYYLR